MLELNSQDIHLGKVAPNKQQAIMQIAEDLVKNGFVAAGYEKGMLAREAQNSTFLGNGIAIPHGTTDTRELVQKTGVQIHHFPAGVDWGNGNTVYLAIGIAAKSDEHLGILKQLTHVLSADGIDAALKAATTTQEILAILRGESVKGLFFDPSLITVHFPVTDLTALIAVGASKLRGHQLVGQPFVAAIVSKAPVHIGQGLWLVAENTEVKQTSLAFTSAQTEFSYQDLPVKGVLVVAANGSQHAEIMQIISELRLNHKLDSLFVDAPEEIYNTLTELRQAGLSATFTIRNPHGLHARPGASLVNVAKQFESQIWVTNVTAQTKQVNAKSLMKVIALGVKQGHELEFVADGPDAEQAIAAIGQAIANGLGEG